jgi:hypothetical protein
MLRTSNRLFAAAFLIGVLVCWTGNTLAQEEPTGTGTSKEPDLRTRVRSAQCSWAIEFGLRFIDPNLDDPNEAPSLPFVALRQGVAVETNGRIGLVVRNFQASPPGGRLSFNFFRGQDGELPISAPGYTNLDPAVAFSKTNRLQAPAIDAPPSVSRTHPEETEVIRFRATYQPSDPSIVCEPITDSVVVTWVWNGNPGAKGPWRFIDLEQNNYLKTLEKEKVKGKIDCPRAFARDGRQEGYGRAFPKDTPD